ncbi:Ig-like domain-containing protein [Pedobacter sp. PLR]|uniref:Ig-like domain-containing protein n=1 Tax=Pedobacter sp. PLR TaxID=2994465 RepID=UPI002247BBA5|nr:Ig-like domain-containing protein [Pedobacter sp. PLR]MCX2452939.1 Ig-like domain-containing protein [Pedobacter sp. PLR]
MAKNSIISNFRIFTSLLVLTSLIYSCASIQQPQGGPRDTEAPKVLSMEPKNFTTNFKEKKIIIEFDEYFKLQNESKEFSISPELKIPPLLKVKKKILEISFPDTLEKNTTYTLNFGKLIADINENNVLKNFSYVFSTGPKLDSLSIKGKVTNSITGEPEIEAVAFILPLDRDTLFGKGRPAIYALTDSSGNYTLNNLREGSYKVYALKEKGGDKIYQQSTDEIGFIKEPIVLNKPMDSLNLKIFKEDATVFRILDKRINADGSISFAFNQKLQKPEIAVLEPAALNTTKYLKFSKNNDSLKMWLTDMSFDSTKISIKENGKLLQTTTLLRGKKETYTRVLNATDNLEDQTLNPNRPLKLTFNFPVLSTDIAKMQLLEDSVKRTTFTLEKDSTDFLSYYIKYPWRIKKSYEMKFEAGAFTAILNTKNKEFIKDFKLGNKDDYGTLILKLVVPEQNKSYIVEVIDESKNPVNTIVVTKDTTVRFNNYKAGKYFTRITYDNNKNKKWDTGSVAEGRQPEKIWNEPKELSIRALWERNETINIPKE